MAGRSYGKYYAVDGSAARQLDNTAYEVEQEKSNVSVIRVRRNQEAALQMSFSYVMLLLAACCAVLFFCTSYLQTRVELTRRMDNIKVLEKNLANLRTENDAMETAIKTSLDLDYVYRIATEELGMVYANKDQVILYDQTESEYVRQYEDIPKY